MVTAGDGIGPLTRFPLRSKELYLICALCYCNCLREIYASLLSDTYCDRLSTDLKTIKLIRPSDMRDRLSILWPWVNCR